MNLIDSGNVTMAASANTTGTMPPISNRICQPYCGTSAAAAKPASAPPSGTRPTAMIASVARRLRGADSALMATRLGMTPPMPSPAKKRSQDNSVRLVE